MGALDWLAGKLGYAPRPRGVRVGFAAAEIGRLTASLSAESEYINDTLRHQLRALRARSRQAAQNNPYGRRFAQMVVDNVGGPVPFKLQAKVKFKKGDLDTAANARIESAWRGWGRKGHCELTGRFSWNAVQRLLIRALAVDGELLVRIHRGKQYGPYGYQLQILDVDRLDDLKNERLKGGGAIHMGVELDTNSRPVAYHILKRKPASWLTGGYPREHDRVPAEEILHVFVPEFAEQVRGVPWMYAALLNLVHIGAFAEAAVIAARIGATQMGIIQSPDGTPPLGDGTDAKGNPQINAEPGTFPVLPPGYEMSNGWNPKYPDAAIEPFLKACLRGVSVGVNVAYHNLAGDMEGVNYSSARIAELDERDHWMTVQAFLAEHLHEPLYCDWMPVQALNGVLPFDLARLDKYEDVYWQARRWGWVDPLKEVNASIAAIDARLKSRTRIIAEGGEDIEDVFNEVAEEEALAAAKKITLGPAKPVAAAPAPAAAPANEDDDDKKGGGVRDINVNIAEGAIRSEVTMPQRDTKVELVAENGKGIAVALGQAASVFEESRKTAERGQQRLLEAITKLTTTVAQQPQPPAPEVHVKVEPTPIEVRVEPTPVEVNVNLPARKSVSDIERDDNGDITRVTQVEKNA